MFAHARYLSLVRNFSIYIYIIVLSNVIMFSVDILIYNSLSDYR